METVTWDGSNQTIVTMTPFRTILDRLQLLPTGGPGTCVFAITNACNARCDFCGYAHSRIPAPARVWADLDRSQNAIEVLFKRGIRSLTFTGGEPTTHRGLTDMISHAVGLGMATTLISNGFLLSRAVVEQIHSAGLGLLLLSVDAAQSTQHDANRGLTASFARVAAACRHARELGLATGAAVTINRLITDYAALARALAEAGFTTVRFCYPKRAAYSSSCAFSTNSALIDYSASELVGQFESIERLRSRITVLNPPGALNDMIRHLNGEPEHYPCLGGCKSFYLDFNFDLYRCDYWPEPIGQVEQFSRLPLVRDNCTRCMSDEFRDAAVDQYLAMTVADILHHLAGLHLELAWRAASARPIAQAVRRWWTNR
ncbi:Radical SAM protein [uncultured Gammaproteobacteria bacterium]